MGATCVGVAAPAALAGWAEDVVEAPVGALACAVEVVCTDACAGAAVEVVCTGACAGAAVDVVGCEAEVVVLADVEVA